MRVVALSRDLNVTSKLNMVRQGGHSLEVQSSLPRVLESLVQSPANLVFVDLTCEVVDAAVAAAIRAANRQPCLIAVFAPHVQEQKLASAAAAGCEYVWARGQWEHELWKLLA